MEHEIDGMEVQWICGVCETENVDLFNWTSFPMCENIQCNQDFMWDEILTADEINSLSAEMMPDRYGHLVE